MFHQLCELDKHHGNIIPLNFCECDKRQISKEYFCLYPSISLSLSVSLFVSLSLSLFRSLSLALSLSLSLSLSFNLSRCLHLPSLCFSISLYRCFSLFITVPLRPCQPLSFSISFSLYLSLYLFLSLYWSLSHSVCLSF